MDKEIKKKFDRANYIGMILIIVGYVSFSNHDKIGDIIVLTGTLTILINNCVKWKERREALKIGQSNT
ncbi:MAG: hypothetical protein BalsKO_07300 [Balneolaceae bacterium]